MKKIITLIACIGLLFSVAACSKNKIEDEALDKLEAGIKKFSEVTSFDYTIGADAPTMDGKVELYGTLLLKDKPELSATLNIDAQGQKIDKFMEIYFKDNMMYMSALGSKQKQKADMSGLSGNTLDPDTLKVDKEKLKESLDEATIKDNKLHLVIKKDLIKKSFEENGTNLSSVKIDEVTGMAMDIELEKDFMKSATITVEGKSEGKAATFQVYLKLDNINSAGDIAYPDDLDSWSEAESNS